jgi:hypothetical protein
MSFRDDENETLRNLIFFEGLRAMERRTSLAYYFSGEEFGAGKREA